LTLELPANSEFGNT
jgi:hypothetical protein